MFPFTVIIIKQFLSDKSDTQILGLIEEFVRSKNEQNVERGSNSLVLKPNFFQLISSRYFGLIERGEFLIENDRIVFKFNMYRLFLLGTILCLVQYIGTKDTNITLFFFVGICFGNLFIAFIKYTKMINTLVKEINNL